MTEIRGVLFDVDGTLVDSNYLHTVAWWQAFRRLDYDIPMAGIHRAIGMGGDKLIGHLLGGDPDPEIEETLDSTHGAVFSTFWPSLRAFDGAADLLRATAGRGLAVVLASSASAADLDALRAAIDADDAITKATSSSDAVESKPAPDILQAALDSADLRAKDTVFVGDSIWDIKSAAKLGIPTVALTCGGTSEAELRDAGAEQVFAGPRELLEHLDDSLLGQLAGR
ncbi:HAD family hydrolase [Arthrobacter sp. Sa2BUA2]|uniref:HAD family hydrolase n=1 Tax=Arthrobacter pullicola TaxID=2762224 RepID=A0ABR8YLM8_9MICC|nr:HAD family hydrolase [Arthrobacter pullicola]MBD8045109.1 HAD family hydrolase [Arthrobacter pullicola]